MLHAQEIQVKPPYVRHGTWMAGHESSLMPGGKDKAGSRGLDYSKH